MLLLAMMMYVVNSFINHIKELNCKDTRNDTNDLQCKSKRYNIIIIDAYNINIVF